MSAGERARRWAPVLGIGILVAAGAGGAAQLGPDRDHDDEALGPSRARLLADVARLARAPRPPGTGAHAEARDHIVARLGELGLAPEIQRATVARERAPLVHVAEVENVVVRIGGAAGAPAILVASHHDTPPTCPGAADDAAGVAAMLELARLLAAAPPGERAIVLLFSDGEERGLLGARAFVREHRWARDVRAVVNLEARGSGGRPVLLGTSGAARALLAILRGSGAPVLVGSHVTDAYRRSGNDTDFSVFRAAGWPGYDLAFFGDPGSYHTERDDAGRLDPDTLVQQARAALLLTRALVAAPLGPLRDEDPAIHASGPADLVLAAPRSLAGPLAVAVMAGCAALVAIGRRRARPRRVLAAAAVLGGALVAAVLAAGLVGRVAAGALDPGGARWYEGGAVLVGASLLAAAFALAGARAAARRCDPIELRLGLAALLAVVTGALAAALPTASLLGLVPALGALAIAAIDVAERRGAGGAAAVLLAPAAWLWGQTLALLAIGLGTRAQAPILAIAGLAVLLGAAVAPRLLGSLRWWAPALVGGGGVLALGVALAGAAPAAYHPARDHLVLAVDREVGTARWATFDPSVDAWTGRLVTPAAPADLRGFFGGRPTPALTSPAAMPAWAGSRLEAIERGPDADPDGGAMPGSLRLRLVPAPGAGTVRLDVHTAADVRGAWVAGEALPLPRPSPGRAVARLSILYFNPPARGASISIALSSPAEVTVVVTDIRHGALVGLVPPRPPELIAGSSWPTDAGLVRGRFRFGPVGGGI